ncbi:MAG: N-6 DNA methylase, partial [Candidatus Latescibacteria bacterium]|nr:N-6 DNA methylase [Candidatus Latescibacterota bacterium]
MLKFYLKKIAEIAHRGDAREESYYSALEALLKDYAESVGRKKFHVTTLPKKTEAGNPDFRIWDGKQHIVGYMEAKAPTVEHLDPIETSEQLKRYLHTFPNVILTNFFEFRLYRNGSLIDKVLIGRSSIVHRLGSVPPVEKESDFFKLLDTFFSFSLPKVYDAKALAVELAKRTRFLKDEVIAQELEAVGQTFLSDQSDLSDQQEKQTGMSVLPGTSVLHGFYEAFRKYLIGGLSKAEFADLYAQTITYGLFAARTRSENGFNRKLAYDSIPHTIGILRDVFKFVSLGDLPRQMEWIIDDISEVLAVTDVKQLLHQYFHEGRGKDPIVHFYETFLAEYDPRTREKRGVYYTPEPVVSYMVRSLHQLLKERFDKTDGFASTSVTVLDPAAGTLTFLAQAAQLAVEEFVSKYGEGGKEHVIKEHILKNFYAFELMMAPYAVGHLKMSFLLEELGYRLREDDRFKLYLTNTLEMEELAQIGIPGLSSLSEESHLAGQVKREQPVLVILGNPPYSGHSANASEKIVTIRTKTGQEKRRKIKTWIGGLIDDYKFVDGKPLGEKNPKWLQDDYVKFIRFAQWKIDQAGEGVLGFITNHSYLDNPTFRGMRQSLMNSFDEMYILDLHGNSLKKEQCPDGSKDENVFDIRQGVAIALFIKLVGQTFLSDPADPADPAD